MFRSIIAAIAVGIVIAPAAAAPAKGTVRKVSIDCVARGRAVALKLYIDLKERNISVRDDRTNRWAVVRSPWVRIYDDQFQVDETKLHLLVDRQTGSFRYSADSLDLARGYDPIGTCRKIRDREPPKAVPARPRAPNKF